MVLSSMYYYCDLFSCNGGLARPLPGLTATVAVGSLRAFAALPCPLRAMSFLKEPFRPRDDRLRVSRLELSPAFYSSLTSIPMLALLRY